MMELATRIVGAFPSAMRERAKRAADALAASDAKLSPTSFSVTVDGGRLNIPERLYVAAPSTFDDLDSVFVALMTRHHDGFVREQAVKCLLIDADEWPVPFLIRLIGEYVIEIVDLIDDAFDALDRDAWTAFVIANPGFVALTDARVISYWDCYYRQVATADYVGFRLMNKVRKLTKARCSLWVEIGNPFLSSCRAERRDEATPEHSAGEMPDTDAGATGSRSSAPPRSGSAGRCTRLRPE